MKSRAPERPSGRPKTGAKPPARTGAQPASAPRPGGGSAEPDRSWTLTPELAGEGDKRRKLDGVLRELLDVPWSEARRLIETGKVSIEGAVVREALRPMRAGQRVELRLRAPRPRTARIQEVGENLLVYVDANVAVVRKPAGVSTVPFGDEAPASDQELATLDALVREVIARRDKIRGRAPLGVVHRLDKVTSGLLVFARTVAAKKHLAQQFRVHSVHRRYMAIAHGDVRPRTIRSYLVDDRGDGLRGSTRSEHRGGQLAITHVEPIERLNGATLVGCRLETGRTHQIRIHLSEAGHPLAGENVYIRGFAGPRIEAPRLMLHAAELGFEHPEDERPMLFTEPPPADFEEVLARLRR